MQNLSGKSKIMLYERDHGKQWQFEAIEFPA